MKRALFPGRFLTFHQGHLFAAEMARDLVDRVTFLVMGQPTDEVPAKQRAKWIEQEFGGQVLVAEQSGDWRNPSLFADLVKAACATPPDLLVGGFSEIPELAAAINATPLVVDRPREIFDILTPELLADPVAHWDMICPAARGVHQKRICLVGPESVGKSVAGDMLAELYGTRTIPEFGRNYEEDLKRGAPWTEQDFVTLSRSHIAWADQIAKRSGPTVFEDTEIIQTMVWAEHMIGQVPSEMFELEKTRAKPDLYLILSPDVAWVNDGTRYAGKDEVRLFFFDRLVNHINGLGHKAVVISGESFADREDQIKHAVASICG